MALRDPDSYVATMRSAMFYVDRRQAQSTRGRSPCVVRPPGYRVKVTVAVEPEEGEG